MASSLLAIALLLHPPSPPAKGKVEYAPSPLSPCPSPPLAVHVQEKSQYTDNQQVEEDAALAPTAWLWHFPSITPSHHSASPFQFSPSLAAFPPYREESVCPKALREKTVLSAVPIPPVHIEALAARGDKALPSSLPSEIQDLPLGVDYSQAEIEALISSDFTPNCDVPLSKETLSLQALPYVHPDGGRLATAFRDKTPLKAPLLQVFPEDKYDQGVQLPSAFPASKAPEFPFSPFSETFTSYDVTYPFITHTALSSKEPPLPPLLQYSRPLLERSRIEPLLQNYSSKEYNLTRQPTSDDLNNVALDDQFDVSIGVAPRTDRKGYLFHINLYPKANLTLHPMKQNFVFVIDKSSSIKQFRYEIFRKAVLESLDYLQEGDTFNIYVVDGKIHKLSDEPLLWRKANVRRAGEFLHSQDFNKYYATSADAYDVIESVDKEMSSFEGELTLIFVTDGSSLMDIRKRKHTLSHLIYSNDKRYTLHTACMNKDSSGAMLDLLSTFNRGECISSETHAAFPRKFCRLVKHVSQIITKDIHLSTLSKQPVTLFPSASAMPQMYVDRPFVIYGTIDELEDFDLIVQGKFDDRYLFMKKKIHLKTAPRSTKPLQKHLAIHQAYLCYEHYLNQHDEFYLEEAKKQLSKYKLRAATDKKK